MDNLKLIDRVALESDLRRQLEAVYKDTMLKPIVPDDPFVMLLAKSEGKHMKLFIDGFCEYINSRPTIDAAPVRRGEWGKLVWGDAYDNRERRCYRCSRCNKENAVRRNFCPNCGADMRPERTKEDEHEHHPD